MDRPHGPRDLADWLISRGRHWVTVAEAADLLEVAPSLVSPTLARLRAGGQLFSPTRGAYVPIPAEFRSWGAVPASHFIDPMMRFLGHGYYVGLLSAAEVLGVAHQRPQVFQVVTSGRLRDRAFGRVRLQFVTAAVAASMPAITKNTPTGTMRVSTAAITVLDLVNSPGLGGGLSNVATVIGEMLQESILDFESLVGCAAWYPSAVIRRTGWLLERVAGEIGTTLDLRALERVAPTRVTPVPLLAGGRRGGPLDSRWNVLVNVDVESDL